MAVWVKLGFTALAAGAVYSAFRKPRRHDGMGRLTNA